MSSDLRRADAPVGGRWTEAGAGGNRLVGDADPCACHRALGPDGFSKSGDRYQASLTWLNEPFVPHAEFVHQIIVARVVALYRLVDFAGALVSQLFGEAPSQHLQYSFARLLPPGEHHR